MAPGGQDGLDGLGGGAGGGGGGGGGLPSSGPMGDRAYN